MSNPVGIGSRPLAGSGDRGRNTTVTVPDNSVATVKLQNSAVTTVKIANGAVTPAKLSSKAAINEFLENLIIRKRGADLPDAPITIQPVTDKCSLYVLQDGVLTANRALAMGIAGYLSTLDVFILVLDTSANIYTITNDVGALLYTHQGSVTGPMVYQMYAAVAGKFIANVRGFVVNPFI